MHLGPMESQIATYLSTAAHVALQKAHVELAELKDANSKLIDRVDELSAQLEAAKMKESAYARLIIILRNLIS